MTRHFLIALSLTTALLLPGCQKQEEAPKAPVTPPVAGTSAPAAKTGAEQPPPGPPIHEDFEGEPKLSLFPRIGEFRPEDTDKEGLSLWATYMDHLSRTSGMLTNQDAAKGHAFGFRAIKAVDSVGFFSPLAVEPDRGYRCSYRLWCKLPPGGTTGVGILEYDEFLFIADQFPKSLHERHFQGAQLGIKLTDDHAGKIQDFTFRTGPKTRMVHLVFFREGTPDREPVVIDDIDIKSE